MGGTLEREVKLRVDTAANARTSILALGATPLRARRLQSDAVLDDGLATLRTSRRALRVRVEPGHCYLTYKGEPQPSEMKLREELETEVSDAPVLFALLSRLGYEVAFRYEKYREEFALGDVVIAVDETPVGTFIELEGSDDAIRRTAVQLGHGPHQFVVDSYRSLHVERCLSEGREPGDMLFPR